MKVYCTVGVICVMADPYQRLQHSVQNLLDVIANSQAQVTEAVVAQQHMQDQLQQRTSEMERLSYEIDELHEQLDQETKARLTLVEELARTEGNYSIAQPL
jgi:peptidoglycan hydrolase CwlO-like protein